MPSYSALVRRLAGKVDLKYWLGIALAVVGILYGVAADQRAADTQAKVDYLYARLVAPPKTGVHPLP